MQSTYTRQALEREATQLQHAEALDRLRPVQHVLTVTGSPELIARLQADVHKLLAGYERTAGNAAFKRAAGLAATTVAIKPKNA